MSERLDTSELRVVSLSLACVAYLMQSFTFRPGVIFKATAMGYVHKFTMRHWLFRESIDATRGWSLGDSCRLHSRHVAFHSSPAH